MSDALLERIYERLDVLGLTERRASKDAGLCADYIRNLRRKGHTPSGTGLQKLSAFLGVSPDWLLTGSLMEPRAKQFPAAATAIELPAGSQVLLRGVALAGPLTIIMTADGMRIAPSAELASHPIKPGEPR